MKFWSNFCGNEARLQCNGCRADSLTQFSRNHHRHDHHRPSGACRQFDPILSQSRRQPVIFHPDCSFSTLGWISALPCNRCRWIFWISASLQQNRCHWKGDWETKGSAGNSPNLYHSFQLERHGDGDTVLQCLICNFSSVSVSLARW